MALDSSDLFTLRTALEDGYRKIRDWCFFTHIEFPDSSVFGTLLIEGHTKPTKFAANLSVCQGDLNVCAHGFGATPFEAAKNAVERADHDLSEYRRSIAEKLGIRAHG